MNRIEALSGCLDEIRKCPHIQILDIQGTFSPMNQDLAHRASEIEKNWGLRVPETSRDILRMPSQLTLYWEHDLFGEFEPAGGFILFNMLDALTSNEIKVWNEDMDDDTKLKCKKSRYFDKQPDSGNDLMGVFMLESANQFPEIWFYNDGAFFKMEIDYPSYLDALVVTKGSFYWQYLYCSKEVYPEISYYKDEYINRMLRALPILFPERDYSSLNERYERLKQ